MAHHSALRAQNQQTCARNILYLFDKGSASHSREYLSYSSHNVSLILFFLFLVYLDKFTEELNGVTKMMIALGTLGDSSSPSCQQQSVQSSSHAASRSFYFGRLHSDWTAAGLEPGRSVSIPRSAFSELKVSLNCL